ncbi:MAG: hypothetical protein V3W20_02640, partial [Candidatus Neomarinimicrobiota bacterium]
MFYKQQRSLTFVAFLKKHPHDTDSLIRMALADENSGELNGESHVAQLIKTAAQKGIEIIKEIASDFQ